MKKPVFFLLALAGLLLTGANAFAGGIQILDPWVREAPPMVQVHAGYMTIRNTGTVGKTLIGAVSPAYSKVEFHETLHKNGVASMVARDSLVIDSGSQVVLKPGGYHMMLIAPTGPHPIKSGSLIPLELRFSDGSMVRVEAKVRKGEPGSPVHPGGMNHMQHMQHMQHMNQSPPMNPMQHMNHNKPMNPMQHMGH